MLIRLIFGLLFCLLGSFSSEGQLSGIQSAGWEVAIGRDKSGLEIQRELSGGVKISTGRDMLGRVTEQSIFSGSVEKSHMRFHWNMGNRLLRKKNLLTGESVHFDYDPWDNLFKADYKDGKQVETLYKAPDAIGNLFRTPERKDRKYGKDGRLLEDKKYTYHYDGEGNLVLKQRLHPEAPKTPLWQEGDWAYEWQGNGMLRSVKRPDEKVGAFINVIGYWHPRDKHIDKICSALNVLMCRFFSTFATVVETTVSMSQDMMDDGFFESR